MPFSTAIGSSYYSPNSKLKNTNRAFLKPEHSFSNLHNNVRSWILNLEKFQCHLLDELDYKFDFIGITETKITVCEQRSVDQGGGLLFFTLTID